MRASACFWMETRSLPQRMRPESRLLRKLRLQNPRARVLLSIHSYYFQATLACIFQCAGSAIPAFGNKRSPSGERGGVMGTCGPTFRARADFVETPAPTSAEGLFRLPWFP